MTPVNFTEYTPRHLFAMEKPTQEANPRRKVFICYHHKNDQTFKEALQKANEEHKIFIDASVAIGDIDDSLPSQTIREKIRDEYLLNSTVTILLVGTETKYRKHVDWELYSSMFDGKINKKSGILVILLPSTNCSRTAARSSSPIDWIPCTAQITS